MSYISFKNDTTLGSPPISVKKTPKDVHSRDENQMTLLHHASSDGYHGGARNSWKFHPYYHHKNIVKCLVQNGCNILAMNANGQTALDIAMYNVENAQYLYQVHLGNLDVTKM